MITSNVYYRIFFIKANDYGTAFALDHKGKQYLITAKHLVDPYQQQTIKVFFGKEWISLPLELIGACRDETDIAVFKANQLLCPKDFSLEPSTKGIVVGQDVFFVGFPYKMWTDVGPLMGGKPCPFVKKGTLSTALVESNGVRRLYIDALNNPGFSGGPIVFTPGEVRDPYKVAGVVSKFKTESEKVLTHEDTDTGMRVAYNTGFLIGYDISEAIRIIENNPNGFPIP